MRMFAGKSTGSKSPCASSGRSWAFAWVRRCSPNNWAHRSRRIPKAVSRSATIRSVRPKRAMRSARTGRSASITGTARAFNCPGAPNCSPKAMTFRCRRFSMAMLKRLHRKVIAFGEQFGAPGQLKALAVPVIDALRPVRAERMARFGRTDRIVADLDTAFGMRRDLCAQLFGEHLRTQANAQERPLLAQGDFDPVDFPANIRIGIVGAHRTAEDDNTGMPIQRFRQ